MLKFLEWINSNIVSLFLPAVLFVSGVYFIIRIGRFVFRPVFVFRSIFNKENRKDKPANTKITSNNLLDTKIIPNNPPNTKIISNNPQNTETASDKKRQSPFSSLCLALAGTLGVGNISGVTAAIIVGGAGCVFWIWVCAFVSSVLKFAETVLAVHYRQRRSDGSFH
jgi:Na+/alanine symporter